MREGMSGRGDKDGEGGEIRKFLILRLNSGQAFNF